MKLFWFQCQHFKANRSLKIVSCEGCVFSQQANLASRTQQRFLPLLCVCWLKPLWRYTVCSWRSDVIWGVFFIWFLSDYCLVAVVAQYGSQCQERFSGAPWLLSAQEAGQRSAHLPAGTGKIKPQCVLNLLGWLPPGSYCKHATSNMTGRYKWLMLVFLL